MGSEIAFESTWSDWKLPQRSIPSLLFSRKALLRLPLFFEETASAEAVSSKNRGSLSNALREKSKDGIDLCGNFQSDQVDSNAISLPMQNQGTFQLEIKCN